MRIVLVYRSRYPYHRVHAGTNRPDTRASAEGLIKPVSTLSDPRVSSAKSTSVQSAKNALAYLVQLAQSCSGWAAWYRSQPHASVGADLTHTSLGTTKTQ